jgi:hypothetical protein
MDADALRMESASCWRDRGLRGLAPMRPICYCSGGNPMLRASLASLALAALMLPASAFDLVVVNEANFSILHKLYIAPAKSKKWSEDKLQSQTVAKNGRFTIRDIGKGVYDLKVTDDDDDTCVFPNISVDQNTEWKLTDAMMLSCDEE